MNYHDVDGLEMLHAGDIDDLDDFDLHGHRTRVRGQFVDVKSNCGPRRVHA